MNTTLREPRIGDHPLLGELRNDIELQLQLMARPRPNTAERVAAWIERRTSADDAVLFVIETGDAPAGFVQLVEIDLISGHARLGIAVHPARQGRGVARAAIEQLHTYAAEVLGLRKILLDVRCDNTRARELYQGLGYREVGVLERHFRFGSRVVDVVVMECHLTESS